MQQHAEGSVRHAEKRRAGTCQFANRIARISLDAYEQTVPQSYRDVNKQTCVAAIVAHFHNRDNTGSRKYSYNIDEGAERNYSSSNNLQVMGLGVGTKFLPDNILRQEQRLGTENNVNQDNDECYGKRIRDCHAEILARRAFKRQISLEILCDLQNNNNTSKEIECKEEIRDVKFSDEYIPILERVETDTKTTNNISYRLKSDVTLHFYASSAPCGNATLKKFTKMKKEKFDASLGPDEWPEQTHLPIQAHSLRLGQYALLVKKDGSILQPPESNIDTIIEQPSETAKLEDDVPEMQTKKKKKRQKLWPCRENDSWCPPSCSITEFNKGTIHSCSDKICRWNCLGMQGALLSSVIDEPLYMTTLTVGRKYSGAICQRAVCCRADGFIAKGSDNGDDGRYKLTHPTLMETNVYMDESGTHDMTNIKSIGQDAKFDSNLCWVWWPERRSEADCLDGKTGFKLNSLDSIGLGSQNDGHGTTSSTYSDCSTFALIQLNMKLLHTAGLAATSKMDSQTKLSLSDIRQLKQKVSPQYESAKADFFRHRVFKQWSCRDCRS